MSEGSALSSVQKILRVSPRIDEVELELLRSKSLKRLAALTDQERTESIPNPEARDEPDDTQEAALIEAPGPTREEAPTPEELWLMVAPDEPRESSEPAAVAEAVAVEDNIDFEADEPEQAALFPVDPPVEPVASDPVDAAAAPAPQAIAYCPYCATTLDPVPEVSRRCTVCRQRIIVKHLGNRTVYLAEAAVPVFEAEQRRLAAADLWARARNDWLGLALKTGAPVDRVAKAAAEPPSEARVDSARSLYLGAVDRSFEVEARRGRWKEAARIRYEEALILYGVAGVSAPTTPEDLLVPVSVATTPKTQRSRGARMTKP